MRLLVWQWGTRGAGPRYAWELAQALGQVPGLAVHLSLSRNAEIVVTEQAGCEVPVGTYRGAAGWAARMATLPLGAAVLEQRLRPLRLDAAFCAMPAPMDAVMVAALWRLGLPYGVAVHDAQLHPGDILPMQAVLQRLLLRRASALVALSAHVAGQLEPLAHGRPLLRARLSPLRYGPAAPPPMRHGGRLRLLSFGRLLPYKGLDLLAEAFARLPPGQAELRVVGTGSESATLAALRRLDGVTVENRWVPEPEVGRLLQWADALVLSHREASQSGVAAAALAAGRWVVATRVGGLSEQLGCYPGARLCQPEPAALAAAIGSLLVDPPGETGSVDANWHASAADLARALQAALRPGGAAAPA